MGASMQKAAKLSPAFWAIDGLKQISIAKSGWSGIAPHLAVVYGIGAVTTAAGAWRLRARLCGRE
jgi:hypothetical protein